VKLLTHDIFFKFLSMNRPLLLITLLVLSWSINAQDLILCQQVIGSTGYSGTENGLKYTYTIGEVATLTLNNGTSSFVFTQGFQQPDVCLPVSTDTKGVLSDWGIEAFPNPVRSFVTVRFQAPTVELLAYRLFDLAGRQYSESTASIADGGQIDCSTLPAGLYFLQLIHSKSASFATIRLVVVD
jgi:Secretion system C-terminal sorting domain